METRVYLINIDVTTDKSWKDMSDDEFITTAEEHGSVLTSKLFCDLSNMNELDLQNYFIRIININTNP